MLKDPAFHRAVVKRYRELRQRGQPFSTSEILRRVDQISGNLARASTDQRNFTAWDWNGRGLKDGPLWLFVPKYSDFNYTDIVFKHKKWLVERLEWLDENFDSIGK